MSRRTIVDTANRRIVTEEDRVGVTIVVNGGLGGAAVVIRWDDLTEVALDLVRRLGDRST